MVKRYSVLFAFCLVQYLCTGTAAASTDTVAGPLSVYSGGVGAGAIKAINDELQDLSNTFLKLSYLSRFSFNDNVSFFLDADWLYPKNNFGADFGFNYYFSRTRIKPFMGVGIGCHYFDKEGEKFGSGIGPSATIHAGVLIDITETFQMELMAPYHFVANKKLDQGAGVQAGFIFSSPLKRVKKIRV